MVYGFSDFSIPYNTKQIHPIPSKSYKVSFRLHIYVRKGFSTYTYLKEKYRHRLNVKPDLKLKLSEIEPNFEFICSFQLDSQKYPIENFFVFNLCLTKNQLIC